MPSEDFSATKTFTIYTSLWFELSENIKTKIQDFYLQQMSLYERKW